VTAAELRILITAQDRASRALANVGRAASGLRADLSRTAVGIQGALGRITGPIQSLGQSILGVARQAALPLAGLAVGLVALAAKGVQAASNLAEAQNKANVVFGESARLVAEFAATSANKFGISTRAAHEYTATLGNILQASGLNREASAEMSVKLTKLAADLASFNNIPIAEALEKIRAGLVGEAEPLRTVGVLLSEAAVKQKAMEMGIASASGELTEAQKVQARYAIIMEQTAVAQGDFGNTAGGLANVGRRLGAIWENLSATLGQGLLPVVARVGGVLAEVLAAPAVAAKVKQLGEALGSLAEKGVLNLIGLLIRHRNSVAAFFAGLKTAAERLARVLRDFFDTFREGFDAVRPVIEFILKNKPALIAAIIAIGVAIFFALGPVSQAMLAITGLILVIGFLRQHWDEIAAAIVGKLSWLRDRFFAIITGLKDWLRNNWREIVAVALMILFPPAGGLFALVTNAGGVRDRLVGAIGAIPGLLRAKALDFFNAAAELGGKIIAGFRDAITGVGGLAVDLATAIKDAIIGFINANIIDKINAGIEAVRDKWNVTLGAGPLPDLPRVEIPRLQRGTLRVARNTLALLHQGEMVIPARIAEIIRQALHGLPNLTAIGPRGFQFAPLTAFERLMRQQVRYQDILRRMFGQGADFARSLPALMDRLRAQGYTLAEDYSLVPSSFYSRPRAGRMARAGARAGWNQPTFYVENLYLGAGVDVTDARAVLRRLEAEARSQRLRMGM
jgi:hypothetical protein